MSMISEQVKHLLEIADRTQNEAFFCEWYNDYAKDLKQAADTIESLSAKLQAENMERSADCGGWIPCKERLPEEKINPVTKDFYEYQVTFKSEDVTDIRHYKFGRGHWWNGPGIMDEYVVAWRQNLEPYHEPSKNFISRRSWKNILIRRWGNESIGALYQRSAQRGRHFK